MEWSSEHVIEKRRPIYYIQKGFFELSVRDCAWTVLHARSAWICLEANRCSAAALCVQRCTRCSLSSSFSLQFCAAQIGLRAVLIAWAAALQVRHSHDFSRAMLFVSFSLSVCALIMFSMSCLPGFFLPGKVRGGGPAGLRYISS
jgi:hypothetical protein